jgi:hypothetical protein
LPTPPLPDLFASSLDAITPEAGRSEPRLWVRRLVIWSERGEIVQDVALRRGLNIIWSPDADEAGNHMGHGGGKTSFCRLLRYCLGEDSFGTVDQRQLIANAMPDAHVGAEIMLNGEQWIVVRPIGNPRGRHFAQQGGVLDTAFSEDMPNTTISPLRKAVTEAIMADATPYMPVGSSADEAWEAALAWTSRDQECRLLDILEWRSAETQSRSPSRNMSKADRLMVIRLLLNALQPAEIDATRRAHEHRRAAEEAERKRARVEATKEDVGRGLAKAFGGNSTDSSAPDFWARDAKAAAQAEESKADPELEQKLKAAREAVTEKDGEIRKAENRLSGIEGELAGLAGQLKTLAEVLPKKELLFQDAANPKCPECGQPIPAHAEAFIAERKAERDVLVKQRDEARGRQNSLKTEQEGLKYQVETAKQELGRRKTKVAELEEANARLASAKGYVTLTASYRSYETEIARLDGEVKRAREKAAKATLEADELRRASQNVVQRLSDHFGAIIRFLIPNGPQGNVVLAENGIHPLVSWHGNLTTAAVDSLKVVAFDLAAVILAIEGKTQLPGFWLHDSPREADLGLPLYHRLFELAVELERLTDTPLFQYVVTTTTEPPKTLQAKPWLALQLSSEPPAMRLFKRDL